MRAGREGEGGVAGTGGVTAEEGGRGGCQTEGGGDSRQTEDDSTRGVEEESEGGTGGRSGKYFFSLFYLCLCFADSCVDACVAQSIARCASATQRSRSSGHA